MTALESVTEMAGALLAGLGLLAGFFIACLVVKTHGADYAPFTLRRVLTWYSRAVLFGIGSFALLMQAGGAVIRHIDAGVNHGAGPGMLLSRLILALEFWIGALIFVRRELAESG